MEVDVAPWITPALLIGLFAWMRMDIRDLRRDLSALRSDMNKRFDSVNENMNKRFDSVNENMNKRFDNVNENTNKRFDNVNENTNKRFDNVNGELADQRERMARLQGALEGFLAGQRDRNAA